MNSEINIYYQIFEDIKRANNILLITHKNPDGDALGSLCAMIAVLEKMQKKYNAFVLERVARNSLFLPFIDRLSKDVGELSSYDLVISVDLSDLRYNNIAEDIIKLKDKIINIDHHFTNTKYGYINIVHHTAASTTEVLANIFYEARIEVDKMIATCLLTGLVTDTDNFSNPGTTISALRVASDLMLKGAQIQKIVKQSFYNKSYIGIKFWGKILERIFINQSYKMAVAIIKLEDLEEIKNCDEDVTEGMANFLSNMAGINAILVLTEYKEGEIRGSLRTTKDDVDVSKMAKLLGGGGHKKAAGFRIKGRILQKEGKWKIVS